MIRPQPKSAVFPVTKWQKCLLDEIELQDADDAFRDRNILSNAFLVHSGINLRRGRRAAQKLWRRHDSLRIRLSRLRGEWRAVIPSSAGDIIRVVDLNGLEDDAFFARVCEMANAPMPLVDSPLAEIIVGQAGPRGDVLITRIHHGIVDGHGMLLLFEELTKFLLGIPILSKAVSHAEYIARHQSPPPQRRAAVDAFWDMMLRNPPQAPNVGRKAKGLEPLLHSAGQVTPKAIRCHVTQQSLQRLNLTAASRNTTSTKMLFAGYLDAICRSYDLDRIMFTSNVGRADPALYTYMGLHILTPIMIYQSHGPNGFADAVQAFDKMFTQVMDHLPADAARRRSDAFHSLIAAGAYPTQFALQQSTPKNSIAHSILPEGFHKNFGHEYCIGPFKFTPLDVSMKRRKFADMTLDTGAATDRTGFVIHYDAISFTDSELRGVVDKMCQLTGLEQEDVSIS